jgi:antirestriction protein ArdC
MKVTAYEKITDKLITLMEDGVNPWRKTWRAIKDGNAPHNFATGRNYNGSNLVVLSCSPYETSGWVTYKQAKQLGGSVSKGEKGTPIVFWSRIEKETEDGTDLRWFLKSYTVFNLEQCENIDTSKAGTIEEIEESIPHTILGDFLDREGVGLSHGGDRACYMPMLDRIQMPHRQAFEDEGKYQAVLAHEIIHSTGHSKRLNRFKENQEEYNSGKASYSFEELVAEIGSCFLLGKMGIEPDWDNSASYLKGWAKYLKENTKDFIKASGKATKAVDMVTNK